MVATTAIYSLLQPTVGSDTDLWGGYLNTTIQLIEDEFSQATANRDYNDYELIAPTLKDYAEGAQSVSSSSNTLTIDLTSGNHAYTTLTENVTTLTINNPAASGSAMPLLLYVTQDGTGSHAITWPSSFKWGNSSPPIVTTTAGATDIFIAITRDGGTNWYASVYGQDMG